MRQWHYARVGRTDYHLFFRVFALDPLGELTRVVECGRQHDHRNVRRKHENALLPDMAAMGVVYVMYFVVHDATQFCLDVHIKREG